MFPRQQPNTLNHENAAKSIFKPQPDCDFLSKVISWGTYLARCHILRRILERRLQKKEASISDFFNYNMPYYAALYIAIEGWEEIGLKDAQID